MAEFSKPGITKETGIRHFFAAASYSWGGFLRLLQESAFRQELFFAAIALIILIVVGATIGEIVIGLVLFLGVFAIEAMNTAVEEVIDRISPEISNVGKHAKDLGSFAVFCMLVAAGIYMIYVVGSHLLFR
ncbi:diacylglycerol kinase [Rhizobium sp. P38BS-XIX]|uniref:diacylglycerol kinase n=1 Tax=Rhizobium sp. P38BS-XIX TaxID=2726740 RepID=UPI00145656C8|nr:diacylglycerol kinase [Rhizobium sp. P38BS-XIX]NLR96343.1 diacylglycerol kinase [Rhizobium sp. P38BS-XIX]